MKTEKRTELIEAIIKQSVTFLVTNVGLHKLNMFTYNEVVNIANIVWDTANNEVDEICELKADNEVLQRKVEDQYEISCKLLKQVESLKAEIDLLQLEVADWESKFSNLESDIEIIKEEEYERGMEAGDRGNIF